MKAKGKILSVVGGIALLASCANYNHISENDVYMQKPSELNAGGDESDLTSFAAFKAREKGTYGFRYEDPNINQVSARNRFMLINSYMPFGMSYSSYSSMNYFGGNHYGYPYMGYRFGYPYSSMYGSMGYMYGMGGMISPFASSYYYNSYYGGGGGFYGPYGYSPYGGYSYGPYGYYNPYGGSYYVNNHNNNNQASNDNAFYGKRTGVTSGSSSNRSSAYPGTMKKSVVTNGTVFSVNDQTSGTSRRSTDNNVKYVVPSKSVGGTRPSSTSQRRDMNVPRNTGVQQDYKPNRSAVNTSPALDSRRGTDTRTASPSRQSTTPRSSGYNSPSRNSTVSPSRNSTVSPSRGTTVSPSNSSPRGGSVSSPSSSGSNSGRR